MSEPAKANAHEDYFYEHKWMLKILGLSLMERQSLTYRMYTFGVISFLVTYNVMTLMELFKQIDEMDEFINNLIYGNGGVLATAKIMVMFINRSKLRKLFETLQDSNILHRQKSDETLLARCVDYTRKQIIFSMSAGLFVCVFSVILWYLTRKSFPDRLPVGSVPILDVQYYFELMCLYESIIFFFIVEGYLLGSVVYITTLAHINVHCINLQNFIRRMAGTYSKAQEEESSTCVSANAEEHRVPWKYLQKSLKEAVVFHMAVIETAQQIEEVFNKAILAEFLGLSLSFCFILYHGSTLSMSDFNFWKDLAMCMIATLQLTVCAYWANETILESQAVARACYEVDFVGTDVRFQRSLVLIMRRSQKPLRMTVGKFGTFSLVTAIGVLRTTYSYYMFLRQVNAK